MEEPKKDIEQLLKNGQAVEIYPQGYSMYPLVIPGRDRVVIAPFVRQRDHVHKGDVLLFRRKESILVLHRVCGISKEGLFFVGDNQQEVEGPIGLEQVLGRAEAFVRKEHQISVHHPLYVVLTGGWLLLRPLRPLAWKLSGFLRSVFHKDKA